MVNGRRTHRLDLSFPVLVEMGGEVKRLMAANISEEGMLFVSSEPYLTGTKLRITFCLPLTDVEISVEAEVLHVAWIRDVDGGFFKTGVRFREFERGAEPPPLRCLPN